MNSLSEIYARRARLMARAAVERERVCGQLLAWKAPLALAGKAFAAARYLRRNPQWIVAAVALLVVLRPRRVLFWARNGLIAWRAWRWMSQSVRRLAARSPV